MKSLVSVESFFPVPASSLHITGDIHLKERSILPFQDNILYDTTILNFTEITGTKTDAMTWSNLQSKYAMRDGRLEVFSLLVRTFVDSLTTSWKTGNGIGQPFVIKGRFFIPTDRIYYIPNVWEVLKNGWIQYLSYFVINGLFFYALFALVLHAQIISCRIQEPWKKQAIPTESSALKSYVY